MSETLPSLDSGPVEHAPANAAPGLHLDARQRAMLDEMGVKVWWPVQRRSPIVGVAADTDAADSSGDDVVDVHRADAPSPIPPVATRPAETPAVAARPAAAAPRTPGSPSASGFLPTAPVPARAPRTDPLSSTSRGVPAVAFDAPQRLYVALDEDGIAPPPQGGWLVVADMPPEADGRHGEPFAGEAGRLLDNMLRALQLHDGRAPVHLMRTHRAAASGREDAAPPAGTDFAAQVTGLAPRIVLAMGPLAAQSLLRSAEPLGRLRGRVAPLCIAPDGPLDGLPVVVTYPPAYLLRNPADKARAWADLCLAADRSDAPPA